MNNFKLTIQYDGTAFAGWQIQQNAVTIQQTIIDKIEILLKENVNLIGSGRTDAGVHAWGQVANFRTEKRIELEKFRYSLNSILPTTIKIKKIENVSEEFHSRFDAKKRSYYYFISKIQSPFFLNFAYFFPRIKNISVKALNERSTTLIGKHDFTSFARKNTETKNKICTIYNIKWRETKDYVQFFVEADRFLHGMVKTLVGTIIQLELASAEQKELLKILDKKNREAAGKAFPSKGLFLFKVRY